MNFSNANKEIGQIKFSIKINNELEEDSTYQIYLEKLENEKKTSKDEYCIKLNNDYEINFIMRIYKNEISSQKNLPRNSIKDRIIFFSPKAKEAEKPRIHYTAKKIISNKINNTINNNKINNNNNVIQSTNSISNNIINNSNNHLKNINDINNISNNTINDSNNNLKNINDTNSINNNSINNNDNNIKNINDINSISNNTINNNDNNIKNINDTNNISNNTINNNNNNIKNINDTNNKSNNINEINSTNNNNMLINNISNSDDNINTINDNNNINNTNNINSLINNINNSEDNMKTINDKNDSINDSNNNINEMNNININNIINEKSRTKTIAGNAFSEQLKKNINRNIERGNKDQDQNPNKTNNKNDLNKIINKVEIKPKTEKKDDDNNLNRTYSVAFPYQMPEEDDHICNRTQSIAFPYQMPEEDDHICNRTQSIAFPYQMPEEDNRLGNRTQSIAIPHKGGKISNSIKEKLNIFQNRNKNRIISYNNNNNNNRILNKSQDKTRPQVANKSQDKNRSQIINKSQDKNRVQMINKYQDKRKSQIINNPQNLNKSQDIRKSQIINKTQNLDKSQNINKKENPSHIQTQTNQNKKKELPKLVKPKIEMKSQTESSKELGKILIKSPSSSNLKLNNNLKNKLPKLSAKDFEQLKLVDDTQSTSISSNRSSVTELILDSINYDTFLEKETENNNKERETFCEGFFIASFPKENGKVIENSFSFRAPCGHFKCAKLPAMKPEIIMRYPLKDTNNLDINNLAASICFPTGIKVCYFENNPSIMKDYVTPITNQKGERYYMMTYHFFHKITNSEFMKIYEENPLKHHLRRFGDAYINFRGEELTEKMVNEIQDTLKFCEELGFRDFVYIPYCLCLISKYPYITEMEKCLQSIYYLMVNQIGDKKIELNKLLMFLIHSVPIPLNRNSKLKFYIPFYNNGIEIACPKLNDINIINMNVSVLFKWFTLDNILIILRLILFEKKLLFVDDNYERLSNVIDIFISLIYPLKWIHTYIPIMSEEMINYIETFLPFVNGVHNSLLHLIKKLIKENACETENNSSSSTSSNDSGNEDAFFVIYITENKIGLSLEFKNNFKKVKHYIKENIPELPHILEKELYNKLKKIKKEINIYLNPNAHNKDYMKLNTNINTNKKDLSKFDLKLKNSFIEFFVDMFKGFYKYLALLDNNDVVFNKKLFINEKPFQDKKFYEEFIDTQIFQQFIQTIATNDEYNYFKNMIMHNNSYTKFLSPNYNNKNDFYYYVIPDNFESNNNDIKIIKKILKNDCYINDVKINESGILPNTQRILTSIQFINNNNYNNKNCSIYLLPHFKNNNNLYNDKDMEKLNINFLKKFENYKTDIDTINEADEESTNTPKIKLNLNQNENSMTEKEIEDLQEYIKDFTIKLFSSEKLNIYSPKLKTEIQNSISNSYGRKYFINLLIKNISHNNVVILDSSFFNFLGVLIYNLLLSTLKIEESDTILEQIILLIKSTNFFGKNEYGRHGINVVTLWDVYKPKIQTNPKVIQINFWNKWYEMEYENSENKSDEQKQEIIYNMCDSMICLELPKSFIKNVLKGLANKLFGKDSEKSKDTFNVFIQKIVNAKYVSQALI